MTEEMTTPDKSELQLQLDYVDRMDELGEEYTFAIGSAFVDSMRNTHYNNTGTAIDELIDNSIEAGATQVCIGLDYGGKATTKPTSMAIIDDGHGMVPRMIRRAAAWGGTHRQIVASRTGFGRFGFGLPTASVNQAMKFSIYSKTADGDWHAVVVDLGELLKPGFSGTPKVPETKKAELPTWVQKHIMEHVSSSGLGHGSVVVWDKLDRLTWKTTKGLRENLIQHFGVVFRNYLGSTTIKFDGTTVEPLDPLFITPGYRLHDEDEDRATALPAKEFEVKDRNSDRKHIVRIRYAEFPPRFFSIDKEKDAARGNNNDRFKVANAHRGIIISRMGRQIDVVEATPWKNLEKFRNDDRYWAVEVDFPADLDEEFTISNTKQNVVMSDRVWDILENVGGLRTGIEQMRKNYKKRTADLKAQPTAPGKMKTSEASMLESEKYKRPRPGGNSEEREAKARELFEQHIKQKAKEQNRPVEVVAEEEKEEAKTFPYKVEYTDHVGAPFFSIIQRGGMKVLQINRAHNFFTDVYASPEATPFLKSAIDVLLFSIGDCELDALGNQDKTTFYTVERSAWSERLSVALGVLQQYGHDTDVIDMVDISVDQKTSEPANA